MFRIFAILGLTTLFACAGPADDKDDDGTDTEGTDTEGTDTEGTAAPTLYDQFGGEAGVNGLLDLFLANVLANTEINWFFAGADAAALKLALHNQICKAAGGGCTFDGSMKTIHAGMAITNAQFDSMVGDMIEALDTAGVDYTPGFTGTLPADILMGALGGMKIDICEDPLGDTVYFNKLGGHAAITAVVTGMVNNIEADTAINARFATTDLVALEAALVKQICDATGGYCTYTGNMATVHAGMCISDADFDALVGDLLEALDTLDVDYTAGTYDAHLGADDLILALAGMRGDIVQTDTDTTCAD